MKCETILFLAFKDNFKTCSYKQFCGDFGNLPFFPFPNFLGYFEDPRDQNSPIFKDFSVKNRGIHGKPGDFCFNNF